MYNCLPCNSSSSGTLPLPRLKPKPENNLPHRHSSLPAAALRFPRPSWHSNCNNDSLTDFDHLATLPLPKFQNQSPLQTFIIWQLSLSSLLLGTRYTRGQLLGAFLVLAGVVIVVASGSNTGSAFQQAGLLYPAFFTLSTVFPAASTILKVGSWFFRVLGFLRFRFFSQSLESLLVYQSPWKVVVPFFNGPSCRRHRFSRCLHHLKVSDLADFCS